MTTDAAAENLVAVRAADAARAIFHDPTGRNLHQPVGGAECAAAVAALAECFARAGGTASNIVT